MGIEETNVSRIFEFGVTLSPHTRGVGAGLTIVRKIVDFHKGEIKVYKPGNGTGFGIIMHFPEIGDSAL
jgi:signal transduction histidine kinase